MADTNADQAPTEGITQEELQLAARNHGMPLEGLRYDVTPVGLHYRSIHFDIPPADEATWTVEVGGAGRAAPVAHDADLRARPAVTTPVTMECAGNGGRACTRAPFSQPWLAEASAPPRGPARRSRRSARGRTRAGGGRARLRGRRPRLQGGVEHDYERSLPVAEAMREDVLLAYEVNGVPLPPQHGFPVRPGAGLVRHDEREVAAEDQRGRRAVHGVPAVGVRDPRRRGRPRHAGHTDRAARADGAAGFPEFFTRARVLEAGPARSRAGPGPAAPRSSGSRSAPTAVTPGRDAALAPLRAVRLARWHTCGTPRPGSTSSWSARPTERARRSRSSSRGTTTGSRTTWCSACR